SASDRVKVLKNIECIGVSPEKFDALITGTDVKNKKPDPEIFLKAAKTAGEEPSDCVVFEDALSGVKAAKAAGMTAIAVTTSFDEKQLYEVGADKVVPDLREVLEDLEKERK
ncbi:MAG: HAD family phosphatase, partial [Clostridia bacterium]|nr:HAD family phosphatase [Clostridia bacterium]